MILLIPAITLMITAQILTTASQEHTVTDDPCADLHSCSTCLSRTMCSWCINKSHCTKNSCGNDNVIYPESVQALMTGKQFCPRIAENYSVTVRSGEKKIFEVKTTQIYIFMAFTRWKCKIAVNGKEVIVDATAILDVAFCDPVEMSNDTDSAYIDGSVSVLWDDNKQFDGALYFKVCRCDLDSRCVACKK